MGGFFFTLVYIEHMGGGLGLGTDKNSITPPPHPPLLLPYCKIVKRTFATPELERQVFYRDPPTDTLQKSAVADYTETLIDRRRLPGQDPAQPVAAADPPRPS